MQKESCGFRCFINTCTFALMDYKQKISLIECPRDAMQGWPHFIPTPQKIEYINALLRVGFHTLDFGSFVSPKAIPQMADTNLVLKGLQLADSTTKLLAIVANTRGAREALLHNEISYLGFPFSISETFQLRNTNSSITASLETVREVQELCIKNNKQLVVYISMAFGNPYGDVYNEEIVMQWVQILISMGINIISVADTVGIARPSQIATIISRLVITYPETEIGVHLHSTVDSLALKVEAALNAGCKRFDVAMKGIGGCPMAGNDLVGNMDTELVNHYFCQRDYETGINQEALELCSALASKIFI